ncbi:hypothetical protein Dimus_037772, partial [Dionaea muscipula]
MKKKLIFFRSVLSLLGFLAPRWFSLAAENKGSSTPTPNGLVPKEVNAAAIDGNGSGNDAGKDDNPNNNDECDLPE